MVALLLAPLYILINLYVVRWMFRWMRACHHIFDSLLFQICFSGIYIIFATALLTSFLIQHPEPLHRFLKHMGNYFLGTFLYIILVILLVDAGRLILKYLFHAQFIQSRRTFVITGGICTCAILFLSIYGILHVKDIKVTSYDVSINKTVQKMDSLKIVFLADTHFGYSIGASQAEHLVNKINAENADLVCFAGDIFDNEFDAIDDPTAIKEALSKIQSKYGVYACWGNHDLNEPILAGFTFGGTEDYQDFRMEELLKDAGITLLNDETVLIDDSFYLTGRRDYSRAKKVEGSRKNAAQLMESLDLDKPVIVIDHQPRELSELSHAGVDLDLCGHTHNGQIFPGNLYVALTWENACGHIQKGSMHNIVTSGAGVWGPNMRVATDCEICTVNVHFANNVHFTNSSPDA